MKNKRKKNRMNIIKEREEGGREGWEEEKEGGKWKEGEDKKEKKTKKSKWSGISYSCFVRLYYHRHSMGLVKPSTEGK